MKPIKSIMVAINCHLCNSYVRNTYKDVKKHFMSAHNEKITSSAWKTFSKKIMRGLAAKPQLKKITKSQRVVARERTNANQKKGMEAPEQESTSLKVEEPMSYQEICEFERVFDQHQPKMPENQN